MTINQEDVDIKMEEYSEFEFEEFSVFLDRANDLWYLETHADEDEVERVTVENQEGMSYSHNEEFFRSVGFSEEDFNSLKEFMRGKNL